MFSRCVATLIIVIIGHMLTDPPVHAQETTQTEREAMYYRLPGVPFYVKGCSGQYRHLEAGPQDQLQDDAPCSTPRFCAVRSPLLGHEPPYQGLPFDNFTFVDEGEQAVKFAVEDKEFILRLDTYGISRAPAVSEEKNNVYDK